MPNGSTNDSQFFNAGAGGILGVNDLQMSVDKFSSSVDKLGSIVGNMSTDSGRGSSASKSAPAQASQARGAKFTTGFFPKMLSPDQVSGLNSSMSRYGGSRMTFGQITAMNASMQGGLAGSGSGGNISPPNPMGAGNANGGGSGTAGAIVGGLSAIGGAIAGYGAQQLPMQIAMNAYATTSMYGVAAGMGNQYGRLYNQAFGTYNNNVNAIANSAYDAAQGQLTLNQISGSPFSAGPLGTAAAGATNAYGYINPSLGYSGAAQMAAQLYSPQTSLLMRQMGYQTPRPMAGTGGGFQSSAQVAQSILQRAYGKGSVNQNTLNAGLANGGKLNLNLQYLGLNPQQYGPTLQAYNKLFQQGMSPTAAQNLFNGAAKNQGTAQKQLSQALYGNSNPSDLQKLKNNQALLTGRSSGEAPAFNQGLDDAASALYRFNEALNNVLKGPLGNAAGFAAGATSLKSVTGGSFLSGGIGGILGMLGAKALGGVGGSIFKGIGGIAGKIFGGGGGARGIGGLFSDLFSSGGGEGAAAAAGSGLGGGLLDILGPIGAALGIGAASHYTMPKSLRDNAGLPPGFDYKKMGTPGNPVWNPMPSGYGGAGGITAGGSTLTHGSSPKNTVTNNVPGSVKTAISDAEQQLGKPYVWGGENPQVGFDCSGLVQWSYAQAGVNIPRTSQAQWAALSGKSVPLNKVQAGDLIFTAGSDGTATSPGHVAMMISNSQFIEAQQTGVPIHIRSYSAGDWEHAARPVGGVNNVSTNNPNNPAQASAGPSNSNHAGNAGLGLAAGDYGSSSELSNVQSALLGGIMTGGGSSSSFGSSSQGNGQGSGPSNNGKGSGNNNVSTSGGGDPSANRALAQKMAASMYGWTGAQWSQGLLPLWTQESGFNSNAQNPTSTAFGIAQFLDSTWSGYGPKTSNPGLQIKYGLEYIHGRYGTPIGAEAHERSFNWYGTGSMGAASGLAIVGDRGPELVRLSGGQQIESAAKTRELLSGQTAKAAQAPWMTSPMAQLMYANQPQNDYTNRPASVELNFPKGAITVTVGSGSATDVSNAVEQGMHQAVKHIESSEMIRKIAMGVKQ